jgi:hypothetical protein
MRLRSCGLPAVAAFAVAGLFGSAQTLAQSAYIPNPIRQHRVGNLHRDQYGDHGHPRPEL